ncbi:unnamed protein product, partial [Choristocarpus tenellus]
VFKDIGEACLEQVMAGFNCTVIAYGQTGSGKSYTMMGTGDVFDGDIPEEDHGIIPRLCSRLFNRLEEEGRNSSNWVQRQQSPVIGEEEEEEEKRRGHLGGVKFTVEASYAEIYNETVRDLFNPKSGGGGSRISSNLGWGGKSNGFTRW